MEKRLLLIEDDRDLRILIKEILEISFQVEVHVSNSSYDSLNLLKHGDYQMVVSDYRLHQLGQMTFLSQLQDPSKQQIPFIIYTGEPEVPLHPTPNLKIVRKPDFKALMSEVRCFQIFAERNSGTEVR